MLVKRIVQLILASVLVFAMFGFTTQSASASGYCGGTYVVQQGDWLSKIARRCGVTLSALAAANPGSWNRIYPGQVLVIPGGQPGPGYFCGPANSEYYGRYYVVCRGDTLGGIARYYGVSVSYLQWRNGIYDANRIYAGQFIWP